MNLLIPLPQIESDSSENTGRVLSAQRPIWIGTVYPRARTGLNQVVEAKRIEGVFLCKEKCAEFKKEYPGGGGGSLIFSYIRRLGSSVWVQKF